MAKRKFSSDDLVRCCEAARFVRVLEAWDRVEFEHPSVPGRIAVPLHEKDFPPGALRSIEKHIAKAVGEDVTIASMLKYV